MKAKLIKKDDNYFLEVEYWYPKYIQPSIIGNTFVKPKGDVYDLSKQNCDEIFGMIDVEKLAEEYARTAHDIIDEPYQNGLFYGFMTGSKKTMELNKDKMFTLENIDKAIEWGIVNGRKGDVTHYDIDNFIQSIQQPTEIDVEIVMRNSRTGNIVKHDSDLEWDEDGLCDRAIPKLDSNGCLILKKI